MRVLVCTIDVDPCPAPNVSTMALVDVFDPASLGITPESITYVYSWGVAAVIAMFMVGYAVGVGVTAIRKL